MKQRHRAPARRLGGALALLLALAGCQPAGREEPLPAQDAASVMVPAHRRDGSPSSSPPSPDAEAPVADASAKDGAPIVDGTSRDSPVDASSPADTSGAASRPDAGSTPAARSSGCGKRTPGGIFSITAGAAKTAYRVVLPSRYDPERAYPLVFFLHGRTDGITDRAPNLDRDIAGANLGFVVFPKSYAATGWEVAGRDRPEENLALLRALLAHMKDQYCIDGRKVVMAGFSSGGYFASRLACTMRKDLAAVLTAGAGVDPEGRCPDPVPFTLILGRGEKRIAEAPAASDFYRSRNGCGTTRKPATPAPCETYEGCPASAPATTCLHPMGHIWPEFASKAVIELLNVL